MLFFFLAITTSTSVVCYAHHSRRYLISLIWIKEISAVPTASNNNETAQYDAKYKSTSFLFYRHFFRDRFTTEKNDALSIGCLIFNLLSIGYLTLNLLSVY